MIVLLLISHVVVLFPALAERGGAWSERAQDPSSSGEDPPTEGDQTGAAHRARRSVHAD